MIGSLFTAITGLQSFQQDMNVVANNIANVNTLGFKSDETVFESMISQTLRGAAAPTATTGGSNPNQIGLGVQLGGINPIFTQGAAQTTGKPTDLMIQGNGFFTLNSNGATYYTRDGAFGLDADGNLVNPATGMMLMGFQAQGNPPAINTAAPLAPINIPSSFASFNIAANGTVTGISSTGTTTVLGQIALVSFPNPSGLQAGGNNLYTPTLNSGTPNTLPASLPTFTAGTAVLASTTALPNVPSLQTPANVALPAGITVSGTLTGAAAPINSLSITFGTNASGDVTGANILVNGVATAGVIAGTNAAGQTITAKGITVTFPANAMAASAVAAPGYALNLGTSGSVSGIPGTNGLGTINPGALEMSNVDLSREFSNMIIAERGLQANSKTITTSDTILTTLVNMKEGQ
jgi:flagellar hook protein FlgE